MNELKSLIYGENDRDQELSKKVYYLSKLDESHEFNDIKYLRILTFDKKVLSWFLDESKLDFFLRFPEQK